jgi:hypothetical protein
MFRWADKLPDEAKIPQRPPDPRVKMVKWFGYTHLPDHLQKVSAHFGGLALWMLDNLPAGPEATEAMRKLLEAKDAAVRAAIEALPVKETKTSEDVARS